MDGLVAGLGTGDQGGVLRALSPRDLSCFREINGSARLEAKLGCDGVLA